eukprot:scaffold322413_cov24-Prasinocladus_malaysianus.AAC.1
MDRSWYEYEQSLHTSIGTSTRTRKAEEQYSHEYEYERSTGIMSASRQSSSEVEHSVDSPCSRYRP